MERKITIIPATSNKGSMFSSNLRAEKRKVAAYARVSTDSDEQFTSFQAQVNYYTKYINAHEDWELADVYSDEGISGTNTKNREGFNKMIEDALKGKFDLIITKSVSRFARNTVDSLTTIRKLKEKGVEVFFEKENIYTFDSTGELLITIMSSLAQEESRSISENVTWGHRNSFASGKVHLAYSHFLGYEKGEDGRPKIVEEEAKIVRKIYALFLSGYSTYQIAEELSKLGYKTPSGKTKWSFSTILSILSNEKYKGDARLQKEVTISFLTHEKKKNEGEAPQYYVSNSHEAIIAPAEWEMAQIELKRRNDLGKKFSGVSIFASKLICGDCGGFYGQKVWHSNDAYKKTIWQCNDKFKGDKCETPTLSEEQIKSYFIRAYNQLLKEQSAVKEDCLMMAEIVGNTSSLDVEIASTNDEIEGIEALARQLIESNSSEALNQEEYQKKYDRLKTKHETLSKKLSALQEEKTSKEARAKKLYIFLENFESNNYILTEWNSSVWTLMLEKATVFRKKIVFRFYSGKEIEVKVD